MVQVPDEVASAIELVSPPVRRETTPIKLTFPFLASPSLERRSPALVAVTGYERSDRNAVRISSEKSCGCSQAAKWPPRSSRL